VTNKGDKVAATEKPYRQGRQSAKEEKSLTAKAA
jgi:hypothetical protein